MNIGSARTIADILSSAVLCSVKSWTGGAIRMSSAQAAAKVKDVCFTVKLALPKAHFGHSHNAALFH